MKVTIEMVVGDTAPCGTAPYETYIFVPIFSIPMNLVCSYWL
jgi:hypothetical protein